MSSIIKENAGWIILAAAAAGVLVLTIGEVVR